MRDLIQRVIGGYKSLKLQGQDEGYVLFTGQEPDTRQPVEIKILPRMLADDGEMERAFQALVRRIQQLNHPNIASIRKLDQESGLPYLVTRALEQGEMLVDRLEGTWGIDEATDLAMQIGQALEHAEKKGVVHGALTPENVVVQDNGRVLVTDFGLSELSRLVGARIGKEATPFLAPEVVRGGEPDARSDVYSLAALLYRLLAGRPPQVIGDEVLPPSRFNPDVSPAMDAVLVRALAQDPAHRYSSMKAFLSDLGAVQLLPIEGESGEEAAATQCSRCGARDQTGKFCRNCGLRLRDPKGATPGTHPPADAILDEPIQITRIDVGRIEVGSGVNVEDTRIARPMQVAEEGVGDLFPEPIEVPRLDLDELWPDLDKELPIAMPEPPPMPEIDWAEIAPPVPEVPKIEDIPVDEARD
jgi:serine/threonine protein kinase